jgi:capsular exopolysaccharide synthesis family protein
MDEDQEYGAPSLTPIDLLKMLKKFIIVEILVFAAIAGYTYHRASLKTPMYSASTTIFARYESNDPAVDTQLGTMSMSQSYLRSQINVYVDLVGTEAVLQPVIDKLGLRTTTTALAGQVTASAGSGSSSGSDNNSTTLMRIRAVSSDPKEAASLANATAESLRDQVAYRLYADEDEQQQAPIDLSIVQKAYPPVAPYSPNVRSETSRGALFGLVFAIAVGLALGFLDNKVRQERDLENIMDVPLIGTVPKDALFKGTAPVIIASPNSMCAESIRRLCSNLTFVLSPCDSPIANVIVIASGVQAEGKSVVATNLATAYAEKGKRVLLIDADLRGPSIGNVLGIEEHVGLSQVLSDQISMEMAAQTYWKENFQILPAGEHAPNPSTLLGSDAMKRLVANASKEYDFVIIDTAPLQISNDAAVLGKEGATILLTVGSGVATKKAMKSLATEFEIIGVTVPCAVMNFVKKEHRKNSNDYYYRKHSENKNNNRGVNDNRGVKDSIELSSKESSASQEN